MKKLLILAVCVLLAAPMFAEVGYDSVSATDTSGTTTFSTVRMTVNMYNQGSDEVYFRLFTDADTAAAATTSYRSLPAGASITFSWDSRYETGTGYKYLALVCDTGETATVEVSSK